MTSDEAGTPADSLDAADNEETTPADITEPAEKRQGSDVTAKQDLQPRDKSAALAEHGKTTAQRLSRKVRATFPNQQKRRWAALTATVTATAGLVAGWAIRRDRPRKKRWRRRGR
jgi:hypothetical protein